MAMAVRFNTVKQTSRLVLIGCASMVGVFYLDQDIAKQVYAVASAAAPSYVAGSLVSFLLFVGFPKSRRSDLAELAILVGSLGVIGDFLLFHQVGLVPLIAWSMGTISVLVASHIERLRSMTRRSPTKPFSLAYEDERRRMRSPGFLAPSAMSNKLAIAE